MMTETIKQASTPAAALDPTEAVEDLLSLAEKPHRGAQLAGGAAAPGAVRPQPTPAPGGRELAASAGTAAHAPAGAAFVGGGAADDEARSMRSKPNGRHRRPRERLDRHQAAGALSPRLRGTARHCAFVGRHLVAERLLRFVPRCRRV